jgi:hypothetical protein
MSGWSPASYLEIDEGRRNRIEQRYDDRRSRRGSGHTLRRRMLEVFAYPTRISEPLDDLTVDRFHERVGYG